MQPLTSNDISASFSKVRPFLLLDVSIFNTRHVGSLLSRNAITSQAGQTFPSEIWLKIFHYMEEDNRRDTRFCLARPLKATVGRDYTTLKCEVNLSALNFKLADIGSREEILELEDLFNDPDNQKAVSVAENLPTLPARETHKSSSFYITIANEDSDKHTSTSLAHKFLPNCLYHQLEVPDIIAFLQDYDCGVCGADSGHTICPGCTGGVAQRFDAFMGCGIGLACPSCLGLDFMKEDSELLRAYHWEEMPKEVEEAREKKMERRLERYGYL